MYKYKDDLKTFYDQTNAKVMSKQDLAVRQRKGEKICREKEMKGLETISPIDVQTIQRVKSLTSRSIISLT